jgi:cyclopropane fatty-acyl-phospholipid synthase-like methyltransferase
MEPFPYFAQNAQAGKIFDKAMTSFTAGIVPAVLASYDFSSISKLVDVGGGHGILLAEILKAHPKMQGVVFDQPFVVEGAKSAIAAASISDRCEVAGGDFFESVASGGDAYIMKHIIHDWDEERALTILKNCHKAMSENGKLLLVEIVIPSGNEPSVGKLVDLEMLLIPGGCERTEAEYRELFTKAGFKLTKIIPTESPMSVIEGVKA